MGANLPLAGCDIGETLLYYRQHLLSACRYCYFCVHFAPAVHFASPPATPAEAAGARRSARWQHPTTLQLVRRGPSGHRTYFRARQTSPPCHCVFDVQRAITRFYWISPDLRLRFFRRTPGAGVANLPGFLRRLPRVRDFRRACRAQALTMTIIPSLDALKALPVAYPVMRGCGDTWPQGR